jgi:anti-sigma-K factor RskA
MTVHEEFADDLALYALGTLEGEARSGLERHLESCPGCRLELEQLRGDMALLAVSASGPAPPQRSRQRLLAAIAKEPRRGSQSKPARAWWRSLEWLAAAAAVVVVGLLLQQNTNLRRQVTALQQDFAGQQEQLAQARDVIGTFTAPEAQQITLVAAKAPPQPQGKAFYLRSKGNLIFLASNMPAPPAQKAYELWLIPTSGAPIPAGVFKPNARGSATVVNPPLPSGVEAKAFAITVEPEAGSAAPSSQPIMIGAAGE